MTHDMEYTKLILNAKYEELMNIRNKNNGNYYERHHIIPYCFTKNNHKDNLVLLTAREHFIAHQLLVEIYRGDKEKYYKMVCALNRMSNSKHKDGYKITVEEYERLRIDYSNSTSKRMKGELHPMYGKTGKLAPCFGRTGELHPMFGKTHTEESKEKNREANLGDRNGMFGRTGELHPMFGKTHTEEARQKIREGNLGERNGMFGRYGELHPRFGKTNSEESILKYRITYAKKRLEGNKYPNQYGYTRESDLLLISKENEFNVQKF